ncbi:HEAT repeat protein [Oesophagostomum dentatum]|uniref:HEAT repeat protein n=1 Tax=Oesophagostomum dentatum TaxID=61180 RepID=A0A0B1T0L9_OESDE|nr:HEAT repeat protein [Oesophagostomum dentatum]
MATTIMGHFEKKLPKEATLKKLLDVLGSLMKNVTGPEEFLRRMPPLFSKVEGRACREPLVRMIEGLAENPETAEDVRKLLKIVSDLESWDRSRVDEPDQDRRHAAYASLNEIWNSDKLIDLDVLRIFIHAHFYTYSTIHDISLRTSSAANLRLLIEYLSKSGYKENEKAVVLNSDLIHIVSLGLRSSVDVVREESIRCLTSLVDRFTEHNHLKQLAQLRNADEDVDFFTLSDECLRLLNYTMGIATWSKYVSCLDYWLKHLSKQEENQKAIIRIIVAVIDAFHYEVGDVAETLDENGSNEARINTRDKLNKDILPRLSKCINGKSAELGVHRKARTATTKHYSEDDDIQRAPVALATVKLLQKVPDSIRSQYLHGVILKLCSLMISRSMNVRDTARKVTIQVCECLGPRYLPVIIKEMKLIMNKGFQVHVMIYTVHTLLGAMRDVLKSGDMDPCLEDILDIIVQEQFTAVSEEKEVGEIKAEVSEAKKNPTPGFAPASQLILIHQMLVTNTEKMKTVTGGQKEPTDSEFLEEEHKSCLLLPPEPKRIGVLVKPVLKSRSHIFLEFALQLLGALITGKHFDRNDPEHIKRLDPFVPLIIRSLEFKYEKSFTQLIIMGDTPFLTDKHVSLLLSYVEIDVLDPNRQATAFALIKALVRKKVEHSQIAEVMKKLQELSITSSFPHIRTQCREVLCEFIGNHPCSDDPQKHIEWFIAQLAYELEDGRLSAADMLNSLFSRLQPAILNSSCFFNVSKMGTMLFNEESVKCKRFIAAALNKLLASVSDSARADVFSACSDWLELQGEEQEGARSIAVDLLAQISKIEKNAFAPHFRMVLPALRAIFASESLFSNNSERTISGICYGIATMLQSMGEEAREVFALEDFCALFDSLEPLMKCEGSSAIRLSAASLIGQCLSHYDLAFFTPERASELMGWCCWQLRDKQLAEDVALQASKILMVISHHLTHEQFTTLVEKLAHICHFEISHQPNLSLKRSTCFKMAAALVVHQEDSFKVNTTIEHFLPLLVREMNRKSAKGKA